MNPEQNFIIKKEIKPGPNFDLENVFVPLYGKGWTQPQSITLKNLIGSIETFEKNGISNNDNVASLSATDLENKPKAPPGTQLQKSWIAVDENYLYVWVGNRWKRTILSEW